MFKFIKSMFSRKEGPKEPSSAEVPLNGLSEWLISKTEDKFTRLNEKNSAIFETVRNHKEKINEKLELLNSAKLANPNISTREMQIMEGNKITYTRRVELFVNQLDLPEQVTFDSSVEFHSNFKKYLDDLNRNTQKPFFVLRNFFDNEVESIAREINGLSQRMGELGKNISENQEIARIIELKSMIKDIVDKSEAIKRISKAIEEEEANMDKVSVEIEDIENKITKVQNSEDHKKFESLRQEKAAIENDLTNVKLAISGVFASLEKPFKKYKNINKEDNLLDQYINEPLPAFLRDKEFKIINTIADLRAQLDNLDLDDKRKEKVTELICGLSREKLDDLRNRYLDVKNNLEANERKIRLSSANTQLTELEYKLTFLKEKLSKSEAELNLLNQKMEKVRDMIHTEPLQEKLKEVTNVDVKIVV